MNKKPIITNHGLPQQPQRETSAEALGEVPLAGNDAVPQRLILLKQKVNYYKSRGHQAWYDKDLVVQGLRHIAALLLMVIIVVLLLVAMAALLLFGQMGGA